MTLAGRTSQACGACKYFRRKCTADCPLAPYFPPDQPKLFQNAHRLFGVKNILDILKNLDPYQKGEAMRSIIYESNVREMYPVYGCWGVICQLHHQIQQVEDELRAVNAQLALYRQQQQQQPHNELTSQLQLGMAPPCDGIATAMESGYAEGMHGNIISDNENNGDHNNMTMMRQPELIARQELTVQQEGNQENVEMQSFLDTIDHRQSNMDSKKSYESRKQCNNRRGIQAGLLAHFAPKIWKWNQSINQ